MAKAGLRNQAWRWTMAIFTVVYVLFNVTKILGNAILNGAEMIDKTGNVVKAIMWLNHSGKVNLWDWGQ